MQRYSRLLLLALFIPAAGCLDTLEPDGLTQAEPETDTGGDTTDAPPPTDETPPPAPPPAPPPEPPAPPRINEGAQVLYTFDEGAGTLVEDKAPGSPNLPLSIPDSAAVTWLPGGGLSIIAPTFISAQLAPQKVYNNCLATDEVTIEAWIRPANADQAGPARIVTYSIDNNNRNFTLGQDALSYNTRLRTSETNDNGQPETVALESVNAAEVQHVVFTRGELEAAMWVNGVKVGQQELLGTFSNEWQASYLLGIGNEVTLERPSLGDIHLAAVFCRALLPAEIAQNYAAGY